MATTVAQLQVEVNTLREELVALRAEVAALREARPAKRVTPIGTTQVFPSPKEAMEACKALVAKRDGNRYSVVGCTLNVVAR